METWNYTSKESPEAAMETLRFFVRSKVTEIRGGCALNGEGVDLDFIGLDGVARVRFSKSKEGCHVSVTVPAHLREKTSWIMAQLMAQRKLKALNKPALEEPKVKPFTPAVEVLKQCLADEKFTKYVEVLPACLAHAGACRYEHDGKLDKALHHLALFAASRVGQKFNPLQLVTLAQQAGLGHLYRPMVSDTVVRLHGDHYHFDYQGKSVLFAEHITLGGGYARECMSIHFHWDETRLKLIIGYFGEHLPTSEDK